MGRVGPRHHVEPTFDAGNPDYFLDFAHYSWAGVERLARIQRQRTVTVGVRATIIGAALPLRGQMRAIRQLLRTSGMRS